ncbi:tripartite tricarboxylate transporter permease [Roseovarius sp. 2305UL8-3]|uniref:tripartite tricarboxylate transporter permease n=1 Tax=Roseovarius conchicola TaxID=3121636 RepID=UPI003529469A
MELALTYITLGVQSVFFDSTGAFIWLPVVMVLVGLILGIVIGATPGLNGPFAMAISLPVLISIFGTDNDALLPVLGFLIGVMKGATVGGAVPAILFNTPGTPDAYLTTLDGYPMARKGQGVKAMKIAHFSSVSGDTCSDIALFVAAPTLAISIEAALDLPEKAALIILSLSFMAAVSGRSVTKGLLTGVFGMLLALVGTTLSGHGARMALDIPDLGNGLPLTSAVLGVLVLGEVFTAIEDQTRNHKVQSNLENLVSPGDQSFRWPDVRRLLPTIGRSAAIGTGIGALPGIGTTLAATLGYEVARKKSPNKDRFGTGEPEGIAATEAANSAVSGANLIPVMSLGIPGNFAAVFLILAVESIGDFTFGPQVFRFTEIKVIEDYGTIMNEELVIAFGIFTLMVFGNIFNWSIGRYVMLSLGLLAKIPTTITPALVLLITLTAAYAQDGGFVAVFTALGFGLIGYVLRRLDISLLPFVIGFILSPKLEELVRSGYSASGGDPYFLLKSPIALFFLLTSLAIILRASQKKDAETLKDTLS